MTWWMWLILVLVMLIVLGLAAAYAIRNGLRTLKTVNTSVESVTSRLDSIPGQDDLPEPDPPMLTQPLNNAIERYAGTQAVILERDKAKRERHRKTWSKWQNING